MRTNKLIGFAVAILIVIGLVMAVVTGAIGKNNYQNYQVKQSLNGNVTIQADSGLYMKWWANMYTVPKAIQCHFSSDLSQGEKVDDSIRVTFNDGGTAQINCMIRIQTAIDNAKRLKTHEDFSSDPEVVKKAVHAYLVNILKATAPCMSASEHQSARKAEFNQLVQDQLTVGSYKMRKVTTQVKDPTDVDGKMISVAKTEVVTDADGMPVIAQKSPLEKYGFIVQQFSITKTQYDDQTLKQFATKKESYLQTESSKAEREREVQQRLMVIEKGLREKAEMEALANVEKAKATIAGELKVAVAEQSALEAEEKKKQADTEAAQLVSVATLELEAARLDAQAVVALAEAEEKRIQLAGAFTEREKGLAMIVKDRDIGVSANLKDINVPTTVIMGGGGSEGGNGQDVTVALMNMRLLQTTGMLDSGKESIGKAIGDVVEATVGK